MPGSSEVATVPSISVKCPQMFCLISIEMGVDGIVICSRLGACIICTNFQFGERARLEADLGRS